MMNSRQQNSGFVPRGATRGRKRLIAATALVIFLLLIDLLSGGKVRALVRAPATVLWKWGASIESAVGGSGFFSSRRALEGEITSLREQLAALQEKSAAYQVLKDENTELRDIVNVAGNTQGVTASVISSLRASPYGTFLIGAGSNDAVSSGALVLTRENFVVGRVTDVASRSSLVAELFAPNNSVPAILSGAAISVEGQGGGNARASVARSLEVSVGDVVTSPSVGGRSIGIVGSVDQDASSAYKRVYIRVPVNIDSLKFVYLLTP